MPRVLDRFLISLKQPRLDTDLAAGFPPETSDRHAARARYLTNPRTRHTLADSWERLLQSAHKNRPGLSGRAPICRARVRSVEPTAIELIHALRRTGPVPARGAAIAVRLLSDGSAPLYNPRSTDDLEAVLRLAIDNLDPELPLTQQASTPPGVDA